MVLLQDFTQTELTDFVTANYNVKPFVGKQIFDWLTKNADFDDSVYHRDDEDDDFEDEE